MQGPENLNVSDKKPTPIVSGPNGRVCPVCGQKSYSASGIHPQCAVEQADAARKEILDAKKKEQATVKKAAVRSWNKKCPKCGKEVHVRKKTCDCGYTWRNI